jgi:hypothetical protein
VEVTASATGPPPAESRPPRSRRASGWRLGAWYGMWAATNTALGLLLAYPLLLLSLIALHARAMLLDRPDSPFSTKEIQGGEADGFIPLGIVALLVIVAVVTAINYALIRRLRPPSRLATAGIVGMTAVLLLAPASLMF